MKLLYCAVYIAVLGLFVGWAGAALPRSWFDPDKFPYRCCKWENSGKFYEKLGIRLWKDRVPDISRRSGRMLRKQITGRPTAESLEALIRETCVAEAAHWLLLIPSLAVLAIWPGPGGWIVYLLCVLGNLPFVAIQRYNRPRLVKMQHRLLHSRPAVPLQEFPAECAVPKQ